MPEEEERPVDPAARPPEVWAYRWAAEACRQASPKARPKTRAPVMAIWIIGLCACGGKLGYVGEEREAFGIG